MAAAAIAGQQGLSNDLHRLPVEAPAAANVSANSASDGLPAPPMPQVAAAVSAAVHDAGASASVQPGGGSPATVQAQVATRDGDAAGARASVSVPAPSSPSPVTSPAAMDQEASSQVAAVELESPQSAAPVPSAAAQLPNRNPSRAAAPALATNQAAAVQPSSAPASSPPAESKPVQIVNAILDSLPSSAADNPAAADDALSSGITRLVETSRPASPEERNGFLTLLADVQTAFPSQNGSQLPVTQAGLTASVIALLFGEQALRMFAGRGALIAARVMDVSMLPLGATFGLMVLAHFASMAGVI
ncbi:MAG: hypothetical protein JO247_08940 [Chloroflexi bacterium]|nr:hypothetical protein [Chloroflexota bacterium]